MSGRLDSSSRARSNAPSLSISTVERSLGPRSGQSPTKSSNLKLYNLPPSLESPGPVTANRRARPGGFAGMRSDSNETRSTHSDMHDRKSQWMPPLPNHPLGRGSDISLAAREDQVGPNQECNGPSEENLTLFAHHCRQFYLATHPPSESAAYISATLASLPPTHRTIYIKLQASLRSLAHLHHLRVRITSFHALISSTYSSGSLSPPSRSALHSETAKVERRAKMKRFIDTWCVASSGGVEPFFRGLWAVFRTQSRGEVQRGGGGGHRVVWEIDDAVFLESGGMEFMHEAVILLKGVLGFADEPLTSPPQIKRIRTIPKSFSEGRAKRPTSSSDGASADTARSRASSDPFTDYRGRLSPQKPRNSSRASAPLPPDRCNTPAYATHESRHTNSPLLGEPVSPYDPEEREELLGEAESTLDFADEDPTEDDIIGEEAELNRPRFRLWTFPVHINDQEAESLIGLFPPPITRRDVRFPYLPPGHGASGDFWDSVVIGGPKVPPTGDSVEMHEGILRHGTGRMWVGLDMRDSSWRGPTWFRFKRWWRRLFGMG